MLDASDSSDADGDPLSYWWQLIDAPDDSSFDWPETQGDTFFEFTPDARGTYQFEVQVRDDRGGGDAVRANVYVTLPVDNLDYQPIDAEFSKTLNRIIAVAAAPDSLMILDPETAESVQVELALAPIAVSVSPDGLFAAVAHDQSISYVSLADTTVAHFHPLAALPYDIVLADNGYAYIFPEQEYAIYTIEISSGVQSRLSGTGLHHWIKGKLHPVQQSIYGAENRTTLSWLRKYDISNTTNGDAYINNPVYLRPQNDACGDLWIAEDGLSIYTACGTVFSATDDAATDIRYFGKIQYGSTYPRDEIKHLDQTGEKGELALLVDGSASRDRNATEVVFYNDVYLQRQSSIPLPRIFNGNQSFSGHGQYVFYSDSGDYLYVLLSTEPETEETPTFAVWTLSRQ